MFVLIDAGFLIHAQSACDIIQRYTSHQRSWCRREEGGGNVFATAAELPTDLLTVFRQRTADNSSRRVD